MLTLNFFTTQQKIDFAKMIDKAPDLFLEYSGAILNLNNEGILEVELVDYFSDDEDSFEDIRDIIKQSEGIRVGKFLFVSDED